jgi:hypothetical protein
MPTVPAYRRNGTALESVRPPRATSQASPEAFGIGESSAARDRATQQLADTGFKIYQAEKQKADDIAFSDADMRASEAQLRIENEVREMRGKDAARGPDDALVKWTKASEEIRAGMANDVQREAISKALKLRWVNLNKVTQEHMATETRRYDDEQSEAYIKTSRDEAIQNYTDPMRIELAVYQQRAAIAKYAERNGLPAEWQKMKTQEAVTATHVGVINRMLANGEDQRASEYYKTVKDNVSGDASVAVEKALEEGSTRGEATRKADSIVGTAPTRAEALDMVRGIEDPKLRDETRKRVNEYFDDKKNAEAEARDQAVTDAANLVEGAKSADVVPPAIWMQLTVGERSALESRARQLRSGIDPGTDWQTYYDLKSLASTDETRTQFLRTNLMLLRGKLSEPEFKELIGIQASMRQGGEEAEKKLVGFRTAKQIVDDSLAAVKIDPSPKPGRVAEKVALFRRLVDEQIQARQAETGREVKGEEVQQIVDNLLIKGYVPGTGFFGAFKKQRRAFELGAGDSIVIDPDEVPRAEREKITEALRRRGMQVTEEKIVEYYTRKLQLMVTNAGE